MYRIDELAQLAGTTSRTIRAYQARGLLPGPELQGRTGFYNEEHLHRLRLIDELQQRGFSLAAIRQTLDAWATGGDLGHLLGFEHLFNAPFAAEQPQRLPVTELLERFPEVADDPTLLERAVEQELIELDGEEAVAPSPLLLQAGEELVRTGIPLSVVLDLTEQLRADATTIADRFLDLVSDRLVLPLVEGREDAPPASELLEALQRLKPIAVEVMRPFLASAVQEAIERTLRSTAEHLELLVGDGEADGAGDGAGDDVDLAAD